MERTGKILFRYCSFIICFFSFVLISNASSIELSCDRADMSIGETSQLTLTMDGISGNAEILGIENFNVVSSGNSSSVQIVNGSISRQSSKIFGIMPKKTGKFMLTAVLKEKNQLLKSKSIEINVTNGNQSKSENIINKSSEIFIRGNKINKTYYFGEKIPIIFDFYSNKQIYNASFSAPFNFDGFIVKDFETEKGREIALNGENYLKYNLKKSILTPIKSGKVKITKIQFIANLIDNFGGVGANYFDTPQYNFEILPLPISNSKDFSGIVGQPKIDVSYDKTKIKLGESINLKIKIYGNANLDSFEKIGFKTQNELKIYETPATLIEKIEDEKYYSEKEINVTIIPQISGTIDFIGKEILYFNTITKKYEILLIPGNKIDVSGDKSKVATILDSNKSEKVENLQNSKKVMLEIIENDGKKHFTLKKSILFFSLIIMVVAILILVIFLINFMLRKKREKQKNSLYNKIWK